MKKAKTASHTLLPLSLAMLLASAFVTSCSGKTADGTIVDSYSIYSSVKVCQNLDAKNYYESYKKELKADISMMKNESEAAQLIFTSGKRVSSFDVRKSDLKDASGNVIPADDITVYAEQYVYLEKAFETSNGSFLPGDYIPDFMIPVSYLKEAEENFIPASSNQGFIVDVRSTRETVPGTYYGNLAFTFDSTVINVPVTVNVWDIEYEGKRDFQSTFWMYKSQLIYGEYDDSQEMMDSYIRMFNDFKVNVMPLTSYSAFLADDNYADYVRYQCELIDESDNYNTIPIPYTPVATDYTFSRNRDDTFISYVYTFIRELVKRSTEEVHYTDYAIFYFSNFDEMDVNPTRFSGGKKFYAPGGGYEKAMEYIIELLEKDGYLDRFSTTSREAIKNSIRNIVNTNAIVNFNEEIVGKLDMTYCPYISQFNSDVQTQRYQDAAATCSNGNLWTYTCCGPKYPYPTFHMDDYNLGTRATGWICAQKHINGYLFWSINQYSEANDSADGAYVDPYGESWRTANCPGDGYLCYPGRKYGSSSPFPSLRLLNYRETMDDYDMIEIFHKEVKKRESRYNVSFDSDAMLNDLYDSVFKGAIYDKTDSHVYEAREKLASRILGVSGYDGIVTEADRSSSGTTMKIYSVNSTLNINGTSMNGKTSGTGYSYEVPFAVNKEVQLDIDGMTGSYSFGFGGGGAVSDLASTKNIKMTEDSSVSVEDGTGHFVIRSVYRNGASEGNINGATERYNVGATFNSGDLANLYSGDITVTNTSEVIYTIRLLAVGEEESGLLGSIYLNPGQTRTLHFSATDLSSSIRKTTSAIALQMDNVRTVGTGADTHAELYPERSFDITDFTYTVKEAE